MTWTPTNNDRRQWAAETLEHYNKLTGPDGRDNWEQYLSDFLADAMHMLTPEKVYNCLARGHMHYEAETRGED